VKETEMAEQQLTQVRARTFPSPSRRLVAAGIKRGTGALVTTTVMSAADRAAHEAASYVRAPRNAS
jgi:hypothetical protein